MTKFISFDVFDTCLMRTCGSPSNMLDVLSWYVFTQPVDNIDRHRFIEARRLADTGNAKENINDIYSALNYHHPYLKPVGDLPSVEMYVEKNLLVVNTRVQHQIDRCRKAGARVAFISDMYLPSSFIKEVLLTNGLYMDGDLIYVSNENGARKSDGSLYKVIARENSIKYSDWYHYGDNIESDVNIPRKLGIHSHLITVEISPYQKKWINEDCGNFYKWESGFAGLTKSLYNSVEPHFQNKALADIIVPYCVMFAYRVLQDAEARKINKLYFCARDSYYVYISAIALKDLFPNIQSNYFYVSQQSLYGGEEAIKIQYFKQIGLATETDNVAIVDIRSTGKSVKYINDLVSRYGFRPVFAYYFEVFCNGEYGEGISQFYAETNKVYEKTSNSPRRRMFEGDSWAIFEMFFAPHNFPKTIGYEVKNEVVIPVFSEEKGPTDYFIDDVERISKNQVEAIRRFSGSFIFNRLYQYSENIFNSIVMPALYMFFGKPDKYYTEGLEHFYVIRESHTIPFIKKCPIILLPFLKKGSPVWRHGSIVSSLPRWLTNIWRLSQY